jgi:hypothetical protein
MVLAWLLPTLYLLPGMLAYRRNREQAHLILTVNLFFGWTVAGWIISMLWVTRSRVPSAGGV